MFNSIRHAGKEEGRVERERERDRKKRGMKVKVANCLVEQVQRCS